MKKIIVLVSVLALVFAFAACNKGGAEAAKVNGTVITTQDLDDEIESLPPQYKMFAQSPDMKRKILDNLVISELLMQQAEKDGLTAKPEIQTKIKEYENQIKADALSQIANLKKQVEKSAKIAKRETVIKELLQAKDFKDQVVSEAEIKTSYGQYSSNMKRQDPNAKVEPLEKIREDIKKSIARTKWLDSIKATASITVNESALGMGAAPGMQGMPQSGVKIQEPAKAAPVKK